MHDIKKNQLLPVVLSLQITEVLKILPQIILAKLETYTNHVKDSQLMQVTLYIRLFRIQKHAGLYFQRGAGIYRIIVSI